MNNYHSILFPATEGKAVHAVVESIAFDLGRWSRVCIKSSFGEFNGFRKVVCCFLHMAKKLQSRAN